MLEYVATISGLISVIIMYFFAIKVIRANPKSWKNRSLFLYLITKVWFMKGPVIIPLLVSESLILFFMDAVLISTFFFPIYLVIFGLSFFLKKETIKKTVLISTIIAIILSVVCVPYRTPIIEKTSYGWYWSIAPLQLISMSTYYFVLEAIAVALMWITFFRSKVPSIKRSFSLIAGGLTLHYFIAGAIHVYGRLALELSYDFIWVIADVLFFGMALYGFLKLKSE